jgi:hypothetical protein
VSEWWVIVRRDERTNRLHIVSTWAYRSRAEAVDRLGLVLVGIRKGVRPFYGVARLHVLPDVDASTVDVATPKANRQPHFDWSAVE